MVLVKSYVKSYLKFKIRLTFKPYRSFVDPWQAIGEQIEFYKILTLQKESLAKAKLVEEEHHKANMKHREEIMAQIRKKEEARKKELAEKFAEGERLKQALRVEKLRLEQIKERKLKELEKWGVPPKYRVDLVKLKVGLP